MAGGEDDPAGAVSVRLLAEYCRKLNVVRWLSDAAGAGGVNATHSISTMRLTGRLAPGMPVMSSTNSGRPPQPSWRILASRSPTC
jgi:hypothetical protein